MCGNRLALVCLLSALGTGCTAGPEEPGRPPFVQILEGITVTGTAAALAQHACGVIIPVGLASAEYELCHYGERMVESKYWSVQDPNCPTGAELVSTGGGDSAVFFRLSLVRTGSTVKSWDRWRAAVLFRDGSFASPPSGRWLFGLGSTSTASAVACPTRAGIPDLPPEYLSQSQCFQAESRQKTGTIAVTEVGPDCSLILP